MLHKNRLKNRNHMTSFQVIIISFFCLILVGTLLLMLPISSRQRCVTSFPDAMFTAVSATCVTGLVVKDTATYWSLFGQAVILTLSGRKIGLWQRSTMQESISAPQVGGIVKLTGFILKTSLIIELIGAALLAPVFCNDFGIAKGLWYSLFHSISAFCNAGFDLFGVREPFSSLTSYHSNIYLNIIIMLLIITGGIGFLVWGDIGTHKHRFRRFSLQSKVVLMTSAVLIILPALYFFFYEYDRESIHNRTIHALFQSVTTRTAGFNTTDLAAMDESGTAIDVQCFKRRISDEAVRSAGAILFMYLVLFFTSGIIISRVEDIPLLTCLFETGSAVGTVGLTLGITSGLSAVSRVILMILMFFGRVGGLTMIYAALPSAENRNSRLPLEKITVG